MGRKKDEDLYDEAVRNLYGLPEGALWQSWRRLPEGTTWQSWRRQLDEVMGEGFYASFWTTYAISLADRRRLETFAGPHGPTMRKIYLIQKAKRASSRGYRK